MGVQDLVALLICLSSFDVEGGDTGGQTQNVTCITPEATD